MAHNPALANLKHSHQFDDGNPLAERNTRWAVLLTTIMMVAEIAGGWFYNSMALLADGWHMSSHALALGLSVLAYAAARRLAQDNRFSFGTWRIEVLGGYSSALFLVAIAGLMLFQSVERLLSPEPIHYNQAIIIAGAGLLVNLACAWLLKDGHHHDHDHHKHSDHKHSNHHHGHHHQDLNLRAAYVHVLTDAATSVLAIIALLGGKLWGAGWLDPAMGIVGAVVVSVWAYGLLKETSKILLDADMDAPVAEEIKDIIHLQHPEAHLTDLHLSRVGKGKYACTIALASHQNISIAELKKQLSIHEELVHITIEVNRLSA